MVDGAKPLPYVSYNDGTETKVGIVLEDLGGGNLKLYVLDDVAYVARKDDGDEGIPRREPPYAEGDNGGVTWYSPRD